MFKAGKNKVLIVLLLIFAFQYVHPYAAWGINHASMLPLGPSILLILLVFLVYWLVHSGRLTNVDVIHKRLALPAIFILVVVVISLALPLATDAYGDSYSILKNYGDFFNQQRGIVQPLLALVDLDIFNLHNGERFTFNSLYLLMRFSGLSLTSAFALYGALWAFVSALAFVFLLYKLHLERKIAPYLVFVSMNGMMLFAGHAEVYAPGFGLLLLFGVALIAHFQRNSLWSLFWLFLSCFFALKSHFVHMVLVVPLMAGAILFFIPSAIRFYTFRNAVVSFFSGLMGFALAYFFIFQAQSGDYSYRGKELINNVFLPIFTNQGLLHYGMLHPYHILDWLVILFMWSPLAWGLLAHGWLNGKGKETWLPVESVIVFALLAYMAMSFVVNPLLSAPRDWDLLSVGSPILLLMVTLVFSRLTTNTQVNTLHIIWLGFALFTIPRYVVEYQSTLAGRRLLVLGSWVHQSYHVGSSVLFSKGVKKLYKDDIGFIDKIMNRSIAHSTEYPDMELAHACTQTGLWMDEGMGATNEALEYLGKAISAYGDYVPALKGAAIILQKRGDYRESFPLVEHLQAVAPDVREHHQLLINYYHGMGMKKALQKACIDHLKRFPEDSKTVQSILDNI
jgi:hypothetical protein